MEYLSLDMWMEILSRLGVKDLIRLKSVSKSFLDLISKDDFIRLHLNKSSFRAIHLHEYTDIHLKLRGAEEAESSLRAIYINRHTLLNCLKQKRGEVDKMETISCGSYNGLICLFPLHKYGGGVLLWNPALRQAEYVAVKRPQETIYGCQFCWFGYDDDEYKLIIGTNSHLHLIRLYVDTDTWKSSVKMDENYGHCESIGTLVHRTVHWPAYCWKDHKDTIISYDLRNETFGRIATPDEMPYNGPFALGQVDGCLSTMFSRYNCLCYHTELWVMKEYGVQESWTKLMIFVTYRHPTIKPFTVELDDPTQLSSPIYGKDFYVESLISPSSIKQRYAH